MNCYQTILGFLPCAPTPDTDDLASASERLLLKIGKQARGGIAEGSATDDNELLVAPRGLLSAGWVIGVKPALPHGEEASTPTREHMSNTPQPTFEVGTPAIFFDCTHGVFLAPDGNSSLCYTTSEERAKWIAEQLNELAALRKDKERLDWLTETRSGVEYNDRIDAFTVQRYQQVCGCIGDGRSARAAIDAAIAQQKNIQP